MTAGPREPPGGAVGASPTGRPSWRSLANTLAVATGIGAFLSFVGAFGTSAAPFLPRTALMVSLSWIGSLLGISSFVLASRLKPLQGRPWLVALTGALIMFAPMGVVVYGAVQLVSPRPLPVSHLPGFIFTSLVVSTVMHLLAAALFRNRGVEQPTTAALPTPPRFLERLPLKLRGAEIWAVESEDHYLRLHTSKGQDLILLRLADAVAELEGIEGAQVHRSWWVARDAIVDAARGDGRATLTLKDGAQVPVSRTYAKVLRERRWI